MPEKKVITSQSNHYRKFYLISWLLLVCWQLLNVWFLDKLFPRYITWERYGIGLEKVYWATTRSFQNLLLCVFSTSKHVIPHIFLVVSLASTVLRHSYWWTLSKPWCWGVIYSAHQICVTSNKSSKTPLYTWPKGIEKGSSRVNQWV